MESANGEDRKDDSAEDGVSSLRTSVRILPPVLAGIRADKPYIPPSHASFIAQWLPECLVIDAGIDDACLPLRGQHTLIAAVLQPANLMFPV